MNRRDSTCIGFTMIEMVVVILLLGIIGAGVASFLVRPVEGYRDLARRAALVDVAETALRRMERDIRTALPNSVRKTDLGGGGFAIELLPIIDGGLYRREGGGGAGVDNRLNVGNNDDQFDIHKFFRNISVPTTSSTYRIVVHNLGVAATTSTCDAYRATGSPAVITPVGMTISITAAGFSAGGSPAHNILLSANHNFPRTSGGGTTCNIGTDRFRMYIIETPVTYLCTPNAANPALGTLMRYAGYNISSAQPIDPAAAPLATAASARLADRVSDCTINTSTVNIRNRAMATLALSVEDDGERVRLLHQVQIDNSP